MNTSVSSNPKPSPVSADELKHFYLEHMVPAGQSLHLVAKCFALFHGKLAKGALCANRAEFKKIGYKNYPARLMEEGFAPLHLVNCYLQSRQFLEGAQRGDRGHMTDLASILYKMRDTLCHQVKLWSLSTLVDKTDNEAMLSSVVSAPRNILERPQTSFHSLASEMENLILLQRTLHEKLYAILDVKPATQQAWIEKHVNSAAPLTLGRRIAAWRTLVNNLPWDGVAKTLGLKKTPVATWLGSRSGREQVVSLVSRAFSQSGMNSLPARPEGRRLPAGVTVTTTPDGFLLVEGTFTCRRDEIVAQLGVDVDNLQGYSENLRIWLAHPESRVVSKTLCSFSDMEVDTLCTEVKNAGRAVESAANAAASAIEELQGLSKKARHAELMAKLNKQFSEADIAELAVILANRK